MPRGETPPEGRPGSSPGRPFRPGEPVSVVPLCDGGAVVVGERTLAGAVLNAVGAFVWARIAAGEDDLEALVGSVAAEFDAPREVVEKDVARFVEELRVELSG